MDPTYKKLGANIRALRKMYNETLDDLAYATGVEKTAVSMWENGKRIPPPRKIRVLSDHFLISEYALVYEDIKSTKPLQLPKELALKYIQYYFPLLSSNKALEDENFKKAYDIHTELYSYLQNIRLYELDYFIQQNFEKCLDCYCYAYDSEKEVVKPLAAANILGLLLLFTSTDEIFSWPYESPPAIDNLYAGNKGIPDYSDSEYVGLKTDSNVRDFTNKLMATLKNTPKLPPLSELADFYIMLSYMLNIKDNQLPRGVNLQIGTELCRTYYSLNNKYVARLVKVLRKEGNFK